MVVRLPSGSTEAIVRPATSYTGDIVHRRTAVTQRIDRSNGAAGVIVHAGGAVAERIDLGDDLRIGRVDRAGAITPRVFGADLLAGGVMREGRPPAEGVFASDGLIGRIVHGGGAIAQRINRSNRAAGDVVHARGAIAERVPCRYSQRHEWCCLIVPNLSEPGRPIQSPSADVSTCLMSPSANGRKLLGFVNRHSARLPTSTLGSDRPRE